MEQMENNIKQETVEEVKEQVSTESTSTEQPKQEVKEDKNFQVESPYVGEETKIDKLEDAYENVVFPSTDIDKYIEYLTELNNVLLKMKQGEIKKSVYNKLVHTVNRESYERTLVGNELYPEHPEDLVNTIKYSDKLLNTSGVSFKNKDKMSKSASVAIFNSILNVGEVVQVPLWHSGFWITIRPIRERDLINLLSLLKNNVVMMGRYSNTLIYTNYNVMYNKIITDFIVENIVDHSLSLDNSEDIRSYIKVQDLNILINGLVCSMYPSGYEITRSCEHSIEFTPDSKETKCDYTSNIKIDPKKLLWVNKQRLTDKMLLQMAKKASKSVSLDEVKEYQRQLFEDKKVNTLELDTPNNGKIIVEFDSPDVLTYITQGEEWVDMLVDECEKCLIGNTDQDAKNQKILELVYASKIGLYRSFIKKIKVNDNIVADDRETIDNFIDIMSGSNETVTAVFEHLTKIKNETTIALIATPSYTCPVCKKATKSDNPTKGFEQLIPLDIVSVFFALSGIRQAKYMV